ncbi:DsbE family thiol:disulfide interchange protein [Ideonella sp. A 288]|uniref:DsbE family thiol:disulfide interchange protein n=1 Tax=Ideonella sp. A 288 TaxID=1962181 RepID=UPI000B4BC34C|nr:DsbE family thiol:disulfide interchange protein [Ideonella sp. A 288]
MKRALWPLVLFVLLAVLLGVGLRLKPREVPSPLVGKPAPAFKLAQLHEPEQLLTPEQMRGKVWMLNVWASWCGACREEHPVLVGFARNAAVPLIGLNYKDQRPDALGWLEQHGNPYVASLVDRDGRTGLDYGVYGVPETFVIDRQGVIRFKQIGPVTDEVLRTRILPLLKELGA